ncbi:hypothetical protein [Streptomyces sp. NBC_00827]|uniref:hypothetical protein n=1 Tax=Streptomyces sp. NBC_00827 TaxID=2903677 RepID=UPI0038670F96|nr:hypothetical protein OG569_42575 [Streptomyces sp. NBC_00827]
MAAVVLGDVLPLIGVALGAAGAFAGQFLAMRETKKEAATAAAAVLRAERKEFFLEFLEACQRAERSAEHHFHAGQRAKDAAELTHQVWFRQKCIALVASPNAQRAAEGFALALTAAVHDGTPEGVHISELLRDKRNRFLDAAAAELGTDIQG